MKTRAVPALFGLALLTLALAASASMFPDVPDSHPHREAIEALAQAGVITGNPDGTYHPEETVNRAALLKLSYKAAGIDPSAHTPGCFTDLQAGSWYEPYVCHAKASGFVQGYKDKTFKPAQGVTRAEATKLIVVVFGIPVEPVSSADTALLAYSDVSLSEWYAVYLAAALRTGILPFSGMDATTFSPGSLLTRAEAAAMIESAMTGHTPAEEESTEEEQEEEEDDMNEQSGASSSAAVQSSSSSSSQAVIINSVVPFKDTQGFTKKQPVSYRFTLAAKTVISSTATLTPGYQGGLVCRLYRLTDAGFSLEYYIGFSEGGSCYLRTALAPGNYQLQIEPTVASTLYTLDVKIAAGDGNDGFSEALKIDNGAVRADALDGGDYDDWYRFQIKTEATRTVELRSSDKLRCLIYPMEDVDIFGFSGPSCNAPYLFPTGTYYVGVGHGVPRAERQTYSIRLK